MQNHVRKLFGRSDNGATTDSFFKNSIYVFLGSVFISLLNFAFYPLLARLLSVDKFGEVQALVAVFTQATMVITSVTSVAVILEARRKDELSAVNFISDLQKIISYVFVCASIVLVIWSKQVMSFLQISSPWPLYALILSLSISIPISFMTSLFQGKEEFREWNKMGIFGAGLKLLTALFFVYLGWGTAGVIFAFTISQLLVMVLMRKKHAAARVIKAYSQSRLIWRDMKKNIGFTGLVFVVSLTIGVLYSADLLLIKHYLPPDQAGLYAGVSTIARIVIFITSPFIVVLLPAINSRPHERLLLLKRALVLVATTGAGSLLFFGVAGRFLIGATIGDKYQVDANYLIKLTFLFLLLSITNILLFYQASLRDWFTAIVCVIGLGALLAALITGHSTIPEILNSLTGAALVMLLLLVFRMSIFPRLTRRTHII